MKIQEILHNTNPLIHDPPQISSHLNLNLISQILPRQENIISDPPPQCNIIIPRPSISIRLLARRRFAGSDMDPDSCPSGTFFHWFGRSGSYRGTLLVCFVLFCLDFVIRVHDMHRYSVLRCAAETTVSRFDSLRIRYLRS